MTDADHLAAMHPWLRERVAGALLRWRADAAPGESIRIVESVRSLALQQSYFAQGRSKADGVKKLSLHQFAPALAADVAVTRGGKYVASAADPAWQRWGAAAEADGLEWGGAWKGLVDAPHVQLTLADRARLVQRAVGVSVDGDWGPRTQAALRVSLPGLSLPEGTGWQTMTVEAWARLAPLSA